MWVKSEDGKLYNLYYAQVVEAKETETGWVVCARFLGTDVRSPDDDVVLRDPNVALLTTPKSEDVALQHVDEIAQSLHASAAQAGGTPVLDIAAFASHRRALHPHESGLR